MTKITVTIFTYNRANSLNKCINCILKSTYKNFQLVILDNASTDNTKEIVESFNDERIIYINNGKNIFRGTVKKAFNLCDSKYFYPICDDDYIEPSAISKMMNVFETYPEINLVTTNYIEVDESNNLLDYGGYKSNWVLVDTYYDKFDYLLQDKFSRFSTTIYDMEFIRNNKVQLNDRNHDAIFGDSIAAAGAYIYRLSEPLVRITQTTSVQHMKDRYEREEWYVAIHTLNSIYMKLENFSEEELPQEKKELIRQNLQKRFFLYYDYLLEVDFDHEEFILEDCKLRNNLTWISGKTIQDERTSLYLEVFNIFTKDYHCINYNDLVIKEDGEYYYKWISILESQAYCNEIVKKSKNIAIWGIRFNSRLLFKYFKDNRIYIRYFFDNQAMENQLIDNVKVVKPSHKILDEIDLIIIGNEGIKSTSKITEDLAEMNYKGKIISWRDLV